MTGEYLRIENWPECIPWTEPTQEYEPRCWADPATDIDDYPSSHPSAGSVGETYMGDVCPWCGVPIDFYHDEVVTINGREGIFAEITQIDDPVAAYHPECWSERRGAQNHSIEAFL